MCASIRKERSTVSAYQIDIVPRAYALAARSHKRLHVLGLFLVKESGLTSILPQSSQLSGIHVARIVGVFRPRVASRVDFVRESSLITGIMGR